VGETVRVHAVTGVEVDVGAIKAKLTKTAITAD
jgi:hypothetical protein